MRRLLVICWTILWMMFFLFVSGERLQDIERTPLSVEAPGIFPSDSPPFFFPNMGQVPQRVKFHTRTPAYTLWLTNEGLIFLSNEKKRTGFLPLDEVRMVFPGADKSPVLIPIEKPHHKSHPKRQPPQKPKVGNSMAQAIMYKNIYESIDLMVHGMNKEAVCEWVVRPAGNPKDIRFEYNNVKQIGLDEAGNLIIETTFGKLTHRKLHGYQEVGGSPITGDPVERIYVEVKFKKISGNTYALDVGEYNKDHALFISPKA